MTTTAGALSGVRIFDLTRILAGPSCTQVLGDLGADVIKIEQPGRGDDTRRWGPPYVRDAADNETSESAYFLSANRNKRSVAIDIAKPEGQALAKRLLARCDILVENFKTGDLARYGLSWNDLKDEFPSLIYCSITGFGQTGPYAPYAGYDYLAQAMGGIMSLTGEPDGEPMKVGVGIADLMCGMYAATAMLAALRHRDRTGKGQQIDMALLDTQVAWLVYEAENYLVSGQDPPRRGNGHPNIVPYQVFETADGHMVLACGNDRQFREFCDMAGAAHLYEDPRFATNDGRCRNREALIPLVGDLMRRKTMGQWMEGLRARHVPCSPVNKVNQVFENPQVKARGMQIEMPYPLSGAGTVPLVASPIKMSETPPAYRHAPPTLGQHTDEVLRELLEMDDAEISDLREAGIV
ncbi:MAG: CoA transferase [Rhodospirillales bacterium]|nr:MAG: CoA transferase [Rhodospirillales bacterium]